MRISESINNVTGSFVLYMDKLNAANTDNGEVSKVEIDIRAGISNNKGDKRRSIVIEKLRYSDIKAEYSVHKPTNSIVIKLYNQKDGKLIREIPAAKMLDMAADIIERTSVLLDERV